MHPSRAVLMVRENLRLPKDVVKALSDSEVVELLRTCPHCDKQFNSEQALDDFISALDPDAVLKYLRLLGR